jgi:dTDP-4-dehydrorhamnose reductase
MQRSKRCQLRNHHMAILITGRSGFLSARLGARLARDHAVRFTSSRTGEDALPLDLAQAAEFDYGVIREGDIVILLAAISSPDVCRNEFERAYAVNVTGTIRFAKECLERGARILFFSSDTVYGAVEGACDENSELRPAGEYARMKAEVEQRFPGEPGFRTFRLSYMFSREDRFTRYLRDCGARGEEAEVFHPMSRRIVHVDDVVAATAALCERWERPGASPTVNVGGPELLSRVDLAALFRDVVDRRLRFRVVSPGSAFFEARPRVINMESRYLAGLLGRSPHTIRDALELEFGRQEATGRRP